MALVLSTRSWRSESLCILFVCGVKLNNITQAWYHFNSLISLNIKIHQRLNEAQVYSIE